MAPYIDFILSYWYYAALFVAVWAFWKASRTPARRNVFRIKGDGNKVLQIGGTSKQLEKEVTDLFEEFKL